MATHSCLENPEDRGPWQATVHGVTKSQTQWKQPSKHLSKGKGQNLGLGMSEKPQQEVSGHGAMRWPRCITLGHIRSPGLPPGSSSEPPARL